MNILVTGTSQGIGRATALLFAKMGHKVYGFDVQPGTIQDANYTHHIVDITVESDYPTLPLIDILVNNAGIQCSDVCGGVIDVNLKGTISITERYGIHSGIKAIVMVGSASAHTGSEFPEYCASKSGLLAYVKNVAQRVSRWGATCNGVDAGGVITELNRPVLDDKRLWQSIMDVTPLKRWATAEEIADWIYFLAVTQSFCTGQSIVIDGGESIDSHFVWPSVKSS